MINAAIFKANDIRGIYPTEIDETAARAIGQAYAKHFQSQKVIVGRDVHLASPHLQKALIEGLTQAGVDVIDIGLTSTDGLYFAAGFYDTDGIQATASHNPKEFGGLKLVTKGAVPPTEADLLAIKKLVLENFAFTAERLGKVEAKDIEADFLSYVSQIFQLKDLPQLKIVINANFGVSGLLAEKLLEQNRLQQIELVKLNFEPNGQFPKGRPDPLVPENRIEVTEKIKETGANFAVSFDADGDRCYVADQNGLFIEGCHLTALLAEHLLKTHPGEKIVYEPRNIWAVKETIEAKGGQAILSHTGHSFIKRTMRENQALFGGEMSGHFYYRDFFFADSGLVTFWLFLDLISQDQRPVSEIIRPLRDRYFVSGEINFKIQDKSQALKEVEQKFADGAVDHFEGLSVAYPSWRFNLRSSNTENLLRLNIEARSKTLCRAKAQLLADLINKFV